MTKPDLPFQTAVKNFHYLLNDCKVTCRAVAVSAWLVAVPWIGALTSWS